MEIEYDNPYDQLQRIRDQEQKFLDEHGYGSGIKTIWFTQSEWDFMFPGLADDQPTQYMGFELRVKK